MIIFLLLTTLLTGPAAFARSGACETDLVNDAHLERVRVAGEFFAKNRRLPTVAEIERRVQAETPAEELDVKALLIEAFAENAAVFDDLRLRAAQRLMQFAAAHFRMPKGDELLDVVDWGVSAEDFAWIEPHVLAERRADFVSYARLKFPDFETKILERLTDAYIRALMQRDVPKHLRTQPTRPSEEEILASLLRNKANRELLTDVRTGKFTVEDLRRLIGGEEAGDFRVLENGVLGIEEFARAQSPASFANFRDPNVANIGRAEILKTALEKKAGFLVTSVNAGIPLEEDMLAGMLAYAEDRDYDIIVYATNGQTEGLDERLLEHPRIHLLTHTIQNRFFRLRNIGIMPKNESPFASLDKRMQFKPGQLTIVGHPQLAHKVIATSSNHLRETPLWSTGSLSKNLYPFVYPMQARTSDLAKNYHTNAFLVLEKADGETGFTGRGAANSWHVRPVEFKNDKQDETHGFTDLGTFYAVKDGVVTKSQVDPDAMIPGDVHEAVVLQPLLAAYADVLSRFRPGTVRLGVHDGMDNGEINHHEAKKIGLLIKKFLKNQLSVTTALNGFVQFINTFQRVPAIREIFVVDSNHSYWMKNLLDDPGGMHSVINGPAIAEMKHARDNLGIDEPLEYWLRQRPAILAGYPAHARRTMEETALTVESPMAVNVLPFGVPMVLGPEWRPVHVNNHGHQGNNGARSSLKSHAAGQERNVSGDSHQTAILGGAFNVGTSTPKRVGYNEGGYSSWTNSTALVYHDGTIQILTFDANVGAMYARPGKPMQSPKDFFGDYELEIVENDNELLPNTQVYDQSSEWGGRRKRFNLQDD